MHTNAVSRLPTGTLERRLKAFVDNQPDSWDASGDSVRPNIHGILRYPAMMVPGMQGDILDTIISSTNGNRHVIDPFVGSGTTLTESMLRGVNFTGIDINPLATLVCEAKVAIDLGTDVELAERLVNAFIKADNKRSIAVNFPNREKWFTDDVAKRFSKLHRAICQVEDDGMRKILWVVFTETIRVCSNSRTSTYKLHKRADGDTIEGNRVDTVFAQNLRATCERVAAYREVLKLKRQETPTAEIVCGDIRTAKTRALNAQHAIVVTSPPYGDNVTTIPYGQFSYLALQWIPQADLPNGFNPALLQNTHALDTASLGGSLKESLFKREAACLFSPNFSNFIHDAFKEEKLHAISKVSSFVYDFFEAMNHVHLMHASSKIPAHWILTTGNRTVANIEVPFDAICRDIVKFLGGSEIASVHRKLPHKRMPSRNSHGTLINTETTLIAEFA